MYIKNKLENNPKAYIKHFYTKTAEEFCDKIKIFINYFINIYNNDFNS